MAKRTVIVSSALCLLALPAGWAASASLAASPSATSSASSSPSASSTSSASSSSSSSSAPAAGAAARVEQPLRLHLDSKGGIDQGALPQPEALFTTGELKSVLPDLRSSSGADGAITLVLPGEDGDDRSHLLVTMKRFGKKADVEKEWSQEKSLHQARSSHDPGLYTFYRAGEHGVDDAFTDGTTAYVLVSDGDAAGEIWFSGIGFGSLDDTHAASRARYTNVITPKIVELLGAKVHAGSNTGSSSSTSPTVSSSTSPTNAPSPASSSQTPAA